MKEFEIIFVTQNNRHEVIFSDLYQDKRICMLSGTTQTPRNKLLKFIKRVQFSHALNRFINVPLKTIWNISLDTINWASDKEYVVVFQCTPYPIPPRYLMELKERYKIKYVLLLLDPADSIFVQEALKYKEKVSFDYIFTNEAQDAINNHWIYTFIPYSCALSSSVPAIDTDLYFTGSNKGRLALEHAVYGFLLRHNVKMQYRIVGVKAKEKQYNGIEYNKITDYGAIIRDLKKCNCILEIRTSFQSAPTLRYYEAVCYNKKLLTNNKNVVNLPFYDPAYIRVFEKPEDIDWNWVKERIPVDYHYDGRFSPTHLIDKIIQLEEGKEAPDCG